MGVRKVRDAEENGEEKKEGMSEKRKVRSRGFRHYH